jgi:hypothetical protein
MISFVNNFFIRFCELFGYTNIPKVSFLNDKDLLLFISIGISLFIFSIGSSSPIRGNAEDRAGKRASVSSKFLRSISHMGFLFLISGILLLWATTFTKDTEDISTMKETSISSKYAQNDANIFANEDTNLKSDEIGCYFAHNIIFNWSFGLGLITIVIIFYYYVKIVFIRYIRDWLLARDYLL